MSISLSKVASNPHEAVVANRISTVLKAAYSEQRNAIKRIANKIGRDPRAVKAWMHGECAPSLASAIELAAQCDALAAEINRLIEERRRQCLPS